ncbi:DUF202 domain-containing protein [Demequina salsinemoris]|uniref:DUF202 domain-containing protein n=1 Tax=Demequina salsinemoris TaxID=577470 RepID=UPI000782D3F9|nr:DUF202 domain-containing protein [Demequina salsinemoris]
MTVYDEGLQLERTLLAWRRTCLAIAVGALGLAKYGGDTAGPAVVALSAVGLVLAVVAYALASRRYHRRHGTLTGGERLGSGGRSHAALAGAVVAMASACLVMAVR